MINRSHGGNIWRYPGSLRSGMLDFSVNTNPLGMSKKIRKCIVRNIDKINYYPDPDSGYLKNSLAKLHRLSASNFLIGNGSIELIHLIPRALKIKSALILIPTFSEYEFAVKANNAKCLYVKSTEKEDFRTEIPRVIRRIPEADLVFLCNPNNPTGSVVGRQEILSLLEACKKWNVTLVIDEAFMDFVAPEKRMSMDAESAKSKNLLVLRSLTKFFVVPGIRIGYAIGHKDTIDKLSQYSYPWNVNTMAQVMAEEAINNKRYILRTQKIIPEEREYLYEHTNNIRGIKAYPSQANFLLCKLNGRGIKNAAALCEKLVDRGILIRDCANFRGLNDKFFRIAVKDRSVNSRLISALRRILK